tara:strand:+ start:288 stop:425 length:138 start_codon:yes stop_codon:yes gene_type:complete
VPKKTAERTNGKATKIKKLDRFKELCKIYIILIYQEKEDFVIKIL